MNQQPQVRLGAAFCILFLEIDYICSYANSEQMNKFFWKAFILLLTLCAAVSCALTEIIQAEPSVFEVSLTETQLNASCTEVSAKVVCDVKWTAKLEDSSWGSITRTIMSDNSAGVVLISLGFNEGKEKRSNTLTIQAGSKVKSLSIDQEGVSELIRPAALNLRGTQPASLSFMPGLDWTVTTDTGWIVLPNRVSGYKGLQADLSVGAKEDFVDVGTREGTLTFTFDGKYKVTVPVTQYQTDAIILEKEQIEADSKAQTLTLRVDTNTAYTVSTSASWVHPQEPVSTKALNVTEVSIGIDEFAGSGTRTAEVTFTSGDVVATLQIIQQGHDAILDQTSCGLYGFAGADYLLKPNSMQASRTLNGDGTYTYRIILFQDLTVCTLSGLPVVQDDESTCTLRITVTRGGGTLIDRSAECVLVGQSEELRWYRAVGGSEYLIIGNAI